MNCSSRDTEATRIDWLIDWLNEYANLEQASLVHASRVPTQVSYLSQKRLFLYFYLLFLLF